MKKGWQLRNLSEVCLIKPPKLEARQKLETDDLVSFMPMEDLGVGEKYAVPSQIRVLGEVQGSYTYFSDGDVLLAKITPCFENGKLGIAKNLKNGVGFGSSEYLVFRPNESLKNEWLFYFLSQSNFREEGAARMMGAVGHKRVSKDFIEGYPIPIPPLPEQQRIVAILDDAFAGIATAKANTEKNLQNARAIFESYLCSVFKQSGEGWVEKTLGEIGKVSMCKRIFKEETLTTAGIPFYKIGTFGKEPDSFIPARIYDEYKQNYPFPKKGDVLISASGTIGRRVKYDGKPAYFQDSNIVWIENDEKQVLNDYLYHFYGACEWNSTKGATISRLYNDNLRRIVITFPESFQEQRQIVGQLDVLTSETQRLATVY
ncbi:MAG TPA: restriction endonuclease subunit S, partial [Candidatus Rifleibacterium sp.]|nr:restriction endonuclease subunit S [Candidatus Rifleibacterium sp.]